MIRKRHTAVLKDAQAGVSVQYLCQKHGISDAWAHQHRVTLCSIQPGETVQNAFIESFNCKFRDECLNEHWFLTLQEAQVIIRSLA